jgi:hypothetical protein
MFLLVDIAKVYTRVLSFARSDLGYNESDSNWVYIHVHFLLHSAVYTSNMDLSDMFVILHHKVNVNFHVNLFTLCGPRGCCHVLVHIL